MAELREPGSRLVQGNLGVIKPEAGRSSLLAADMTDMYDPRGPPGPPKPGEARPGDMSPAELAEFSAGDPSGDWWCSSELRTIVGDEIWTWRPGVDGLESWPGVSGWASLALYVFNDSIDLLIPRPFLLPLAASFAEMRIDSSYKLSIW